MKRAISILLCAVLFLGLMSMLTSAASFQITYYTEDVYAGGIIDMYVFTEKGGVAPFTYQWQVDVGIGDGHWYDLEEGSNYTGTTTDHLQIHTVTGEYSDWNVIPFRCVVTDVEGTTLFSPDIFADIYPTSHLMPNLEAWGFELYEPTLTNVTGFQTSDYTNYTAYAYAGSKLDILVGSPPVESRAILTNSEVRLTREIYITENGHTTKVGDKTTYIPYTIGKNAVTMELKLHVTIGNYDLGDLDTKTIQITTSKPTVLSTATAKTDCSLLRYAYNESQKLSSISKGAEVEILGKEGSYYQVYYGSFVGYVGADLLSVQTPGDDPVIKTVDLTIPQPLDGESPAFSCELLTPGCKLYHTDPITWLDEQSGEFMSPGDTFTENRGYTLSIWLSAVEGHKFQVDAAGNPKLTGSINGNLPPFFNRAYEQDPEQVIELRYTFYAKKAPEHTCAPVYVSGTAPTCTEAGQEAHYHCACGQDYQDAAATQPVDLRYWGTIPALGHAEGGWSGNGTHHYKKCTRCYQVLPGTNAPHTGGTASCLQMAVCTVCNATYGKTDTGHRWSTGWDYKEKQGHAQICTDCKTGSPLLPHTPGPAATEDSPQTCTDCGYILTPAKNHVHRLTKVEARIPTCTTPGNQSYYTCNGCADLFADKNGSEVLTGSVLLPMLPHQEAEGWSFDGLQHWKTCQYCQQPLPETLRFHELGGNICAICGYIGGTVPETMPPETAPTQPAPTPSATIPDAGGVDIAPGWAIGVMLGLICFGIAIVATTLLRNKKG